MRWASWDFEDGDLFRALHSLPEVFQGGLCLGEARRCLVVLPPMQAVVQLHEDLPGQDLVAGRDQDGSDDRRLLGRDMDEVGLDVALEHHRAVADAPR